MRLYQWAYVPDFIVRPALFLLYVAAAVLLQTGLSLPLVLAAYVGSNMIVFCFAFANTVCEG